MAYFLCRLSGPHASDTASAADAGCFIYCVAPMPRVGLRQAQARDVVS